MRVLKIAALVAALGGGAIAAAPASATPVSAGLAAAVGTVNTPVEQVQYWGGYGGGYGGGGYRRRWDRGPRYGYRPPVVCRVRYTPYGPRRICRRG